MEIVDYILEFSKVIVSWQVTAVLIAMILRKEIKELFARLTKIHGFGGEFEFAQQAPPKELEKLKREIETKTNNIDKRLLEVAAIFEYWWNTYNHHGASISEAFRNFIESDKAIVKYGVSYEEYKELAEILKRKGYKIEFVIPQEAFEMQKTISRNRIMHYER
jgi:hypothetical protein